MAALNPGEFSQNIQLGIEVVATLAFALSGILEGARKRLDAVGVCVVAFLARAHVPSTPQGAEAAALWAVWPPLVPRALGQRAVGLLRLALPTGVASAWRMWGHKAHRSE